MSIFDKIASKGIGYSKFDLSHCHKLSFDMGELIPSLCKEYYPGDRWEIDMVSMIRATSLVAPAYENIDVEHHFYAVPLRLLYDDWEDWITGEITTSPPTFALSQAADIGELADYLGLTYNGAVSTAVSAYPIAAYAKIRDEFWRDQNLSTESFSPLVSGNNTWVVSMAISAPLKAAWRRDYFAACLPSAQRGTAVSLPLLNEAKLQVQLDTESSNSLKLVKASDQTIAPNETLQAEATTGDLETSTTQTDLQIDPNDTLYVNVNAEASLVEDLRLAYKTQEFLEKEMRGGNRYIESTLIMWGVQSDDTRYHRPQYLGGIKHGITISEVLSTGQSANTSPTVFVGDMAGHGIGVGSGRKVYFNAKEHGILMCITVARPRASYQDGIHRSWTRNDRFDYANPLFAHLGEQAVEVREIWTGYSTEAEGDETFGYIPRYSELKYAQDMISGDFKGNLDYWHLARQFGSKPVLNESFIECNPDKRIFATETDDALLAKLDFKINCIRKLPKYAVPSML
jgi:hypothetical protein